MQESVVRVQIAGVSSVEEAAWVAACGGDAVGFTVRLPDGAHDGLTEAKARAIIAALPPFLSTVAITYVADPREAIDLCRYLGVNTLQLHGEDFPEREIDMIRAALSHLKIIRAVMVTGEEALAQAQRLARRVDAIILDSFDAATGRRGATGIVHDWDLSARIVATLRCPVILAGGLAPDNVHEAIRRVQPWAVDVHTGIEGPGGERDFAKIQRFIHAAKAQSALRP